MKAVIARNYLCFYALLQMILEDFGIYQYDQYSLANELGVTVPKGHTIEKVDSITESDDIKELGAHIDVNDLNQFFTRKKIHIQASYIHANPYEEYGDTKDNHVIYTVSYGVLYKKQELIEIGHAVLKNKFESYREISIYDPGPKDSGIKKVSTFDLYDAIYKGNGGAFIFCKSEDGDNDN